jgi:Lar family restriction alleviation protein
MNNVMPCPFCGSELISVAVKRREDYDVYWAECADCDARGPKCNVSHQAKPAWNRRLHNATYVSGEKMLGDGASKVKRTGVIVYNTGEK